MKISKLPEMPNNSRYSAHASNLAAFSLGCFALTAYCALPLTGILNYFERYPVALIIGSILALGPALASLGLSAVLSRKKDSGRSALELSGAIGATMSCIVFILAILNIPYRWPYSPSPGAGAHFW